jgi:hypothetical protein
LLSCGYGSRECLAQMQASQIGISLSMISTPLIMPSLIIFCSARGFACPIRQWNLVINIWVGVTAIAAGDATLGGLGDVGVVWPLMWYRLSFSGMRAISSLVGEYMWAAQPSKCMANFAYVIALTETSDWDIDGACNTRNRRKVISPLSVLILIGTSPLPMAWQLLPLADMTVIGGIEQYVVKFSRDGSK